MLEPDSMEIMGVSIKKEITVVESDEMTEETCYFCGYPVPLKLGQCTAECGLCSEILTFEPLNSSGAKITCPFCQNVVPRYLGVGPNRCEVCSKILNANPFPNAHKAFMCDVCGKMVSSRYRLGRHSKKHMTPRLKCKYCTQLFTENSDRRTHERSHLIRKKRKLTGTGRSKFFVCDICGLEFSSKQIFELHNSNTGHVSKPVTFGQRIYNSSSRVQGGSGPYSCDVCGLTIQTRGYLVQHVKEHRRQFPSQCLTCGITFIEINQLKNHACYRSEDLYARTVKGSRPKIKSKISEVIFVGGRQKLASQTSGVVVPEKCASCGMVFPGLRELLENHDCPNLNNKIVSSQSDSDILELSIEQTPQKSVSGLTSGPFLSVPKELENSKSLLLDRDLNVSDPNPNISPEQNILRRLLQKQIKHRVRNGLLAKDLAKIDDVSEELVNDVCKLPELNCRPDITAFVLKLVSDDRFLTISQMRKLILADASVTAGHGQKNTQRILNENGYAVTGGASDLDEDSRMQRLAWAKRHSKLTEEDWSRVLWTGTAKFRRFAASPPYSDISKKIRENIWRLPYEDPSEKVIRSSSTGQDCLHLWGCMSSRGFGKLKRIDGPLDSASYVTILRDSMLPSASALIGPDFILQHEDNSKEVQDLQVQKWLGDLNSELDMNLMEWPTNGSDLNPLETVWNRLCVELDGFDSDDLDQLFQKIESTVRLIPTMHYGNLIGTMTNRCATVVKARGGFINCW